MFGLTLQELVSWMMTDSSMEDKNRFQVLMAHSFKGTSSKAFYHFNQNLNENDFREYDYGSPEANQAHYGRRHGTPPSIDISTIH